MEDVVYGNIAGGLTLDFPKGIQSCAREGAECEQVIYLDEMRPVA